MVLTFTVSANAMSYKQAREQALFLTDKMAYELNLNEEQYDAVYEINLDYLMGVNTYDDLYGPYWRYRNLDLSYVLFDWQYNAFCAATYFYRPLYFNNGYWRFAIYTRYPHRDYFYFSRPTVYVSYRGTHSWGHNHGRSWYNGRTFGSRNHSAHVGMRDRYDRGDFGRGRGNGQGFGSRGNSNDKASRGNGQGFGSRGNGMNNGSSNGFGSRRGNAPGSRESSTRTTIQNKQSGNQGFGSRGNGSTTQTPRSTFSPSTSSNRSFGSSTTRSFDNSSSSRRSFGNSSSSRSFSNNSSSCSFSNSSSSRSFGSSRNSSGGGSSSSSHGGGFGSRR